LVSHLELCQSVRESKRASKSLNNKRANGGSQRYQVVFIAVENPSMNDVTVRNK